MPHGLNLSSCGCFGALLRPRETGQVRTLTTRGWAMRLQRIARSYTFSNKENW
jgi:hypothetical protein